MDPDTLEIIGEFVFERDGFKLQLTELGLQRLEEYKPAEDKQKEQEALLKAETDAKRKEEKTKQQEESIKQSRQELLQYAKELNRERRVTDWRKADREESELKQFSNLSVKDMRIKYLKEYDEYQKAKETGQDEKKLKPMKKYIINLKKIIDDKMDEEKRVKEGTGIVDNPELYEKAKAYADNIFKKPSAFKSGFIVKKYKELGGTYSGEKPNKSGIARWFKEEWKDVGNQEYPVFRPTKRITKKTPLTIDEIEPSNLEEQIALKQEIKGDANLPPFQEKTGGKVVALGVQAEKIPKQDEIWKWSNPDKVAEMARKYLGDMAVVFRSTKPKKKYMIFDPVNNKWVFFGEMGYEDFTKHQDPKRRENYLTRTASIKGNWKNNKYSANNLSRNILW
jgi:hypothetical protein